MGHHGLRVMLVLTHTTYASPRPPLHACMQACLHTCMDWRLWDVASGWWEPWQGEDRLAGGQED